MITDYRITNSTTSPAPLPQKTMSSVDKKTSQVADAAFSNVVPFFENCHKFMKSVGTGVLCALLVYFLIQDIGKVVSAITSG